MRDGVPQKAKAEGWHAPQPGLAHEEQQSPLAISGSTPAVPHNYEALLDLPPKPQDRLGDVVVLDRRDAEPASTPAHDRLPLSAFIIARNEEARIGRTIAALRELADDIVVVDSGSTDETVAIARKAGARVFFRAWEGYGQQKRFAEQLCRHPWLLNVDADEVVTPELAAELRALFSPRPPAPGAYKARILTVYPGDARPRPWPRDVNVVRFYHRDVGRYRDHPSYDRVEVEGVKPVQLSAPLWHYSIVDWHALIDKTNRFSSFQASLPSKHNDAGLRFRLYSEFPINFFKNYILRRHFTGGWKGFYFSLTQAFMRTSRIAKMLEAREIRVEPAPSAKREL